MDESVDEDFLILEQDKSWKMTKEEMQERLRNCLNFGIGKKKSRFLGSDKALFGKNNVLFWVKKL